MTGDNRKHQFRADADLMGQQMAAPGMAGGESPYAAQDSGSAATRANVDKRTATRSRLDRWGGWLNLGGVAAVTTVTFVGAVVLGTASVGQYVAGWLVVALCVGIVFALSQAMH